MCTQDHSIKNKNYLAKGGEDYLYLPMDFNIFNLRHGKLVIWYHWSFHDLETADYTQTMYCPECKEKIFTLEQFKDVQNIAKYSNNLALDLEKYMDSNFNIIRNN